MLKTSAFTDIYLKLDEKLTTYAAAEKANRDRIASIDAYLRTKGYQSRPQSTPRDTTNPNGEASG